MSWSTELFCNLSFNRETFNSENEVQDKIEELDKCIDTCKKELRDMALMTEPAKFMGKDDGLDPYSFVTSKVANSLELLEEYIIEQYKLMVLLENWGNCHNEDGLAIYPPDGIDWNTAYLCGDFVKSTKYPTDKDLIG